MFMHKTDDKVFFKKNCHCNGRLGTGESLNERLENKKLDICNLWSFEQHLYEIYRVCLNLKESLLKFSVSFGMVFKY